MRPELELAIHDLLVVGKNSQLVSEQVSEKLIKDSHRLSERAALIHFVILSGEYQSAFRVFQKWFETKQRIPWQEFLNLVYKSKSLPPDSEFISFLFQAMEEADALGQLTVLKHWQSYDSRFARLADEFYSHLKQKSQDIETQLFEKLDYFKSNRMLDQEEALLKKLILAFPERDDLVKDLKQLKTRWAHHFIAEKSRQLEGQKLSYKDAPSFDENEFAQHLLEVMGLTIKKHPLAAYDFAIGLNMMEFYEPALHMLKYTVPNLAVDWFRAELLMKCKRHLECLDELTRLEQTYVDDPESSFASTYLRSQVLMGLGQKNMAVQLMRSITSVRPGYRSAHGLIIEWEKSS